MSAQNNKTPLIAAAAVVLLVAAGAVAYFTQKSPDAMNKPAQEQAAANSESDNPAAVDTAAGNASDNIQENEKVAEAAPQMQSPEGVTVEPGNPIVAKVDGKDITRVDIYRFIQTMPQNVQQMPAVQVYPMAMEQVINTRIVQTKADQADIENSPEFKLEMDIAKQQIARNMYLQQQIDKKITDSMIKKSYDDFLKKVPEVEERRASHILLEDEGKAKAVIEKLNKGGNFEELAKELSKGPTGPNGGDLGYFAKNEMVPEFSGAAFAMKVGEISKEPVKTQFGYHVIKITEERQRPKPTMEMMTPMIKAELSRTVLDDLLKDWRKGADIEQFDINGKALKDGANVIGVVPNKEDNKAQQGG